MSYIKKFIESQHDDDDEAPVTVRELIEFLKTCKPDAVVYYTLGGSSNTSPVTYYTEDYNCVEIDRDESDGEGGVLIGSVTW